MGERKHISLTNIQKLLFKKAMKKVEMPSNDYDSSDRLGEDTDFVFDSVPSSKSTDEDEFELETTIPESSQKYQKSTVIKTFSDDEIPEGKARVGIDSLIKASVKLKHINQGIVPPDERDSLRYKKLMTLPELIAERIRLDAGKIKNSIIYKLSRVKSLKNFPPGVFDGYITGHIIGTPLSFPSEEINPIFLNDQMRRVSVFGLGGISSIESVSKESQNVHPSQFGVIDVISGPDGTKTGVDTRIAALTRIGKDGKFYTPLKNKRTGEVEWLTPEEIESYSVAFPD